MRATDIAGRTTTVTESAFVDRVAPESGSASLFYIDESGQRQSAPESAAPVATSTLGVTWDALEGQGKSSYEVGFSFGFMLCLVSNAVHASDAAEADLAAVWQRVQTSGAYRFSADIEQTTVPGHPWQMPTAAASAHCST